MWKKTLKVVDVKGLAEKIYAIQNTNDELSFATCFEIDSDGTVLESITGDWWGAKFIGAFDGTFLLIGALGGGTWYTFDAGTTMTSEEIQAVVEEIFRRIAANEVCVEVQTWV